MNHPAQDEEIDLKAILYKLLRKWHWLMLFGFLGIISGYFYNQIVIPSYKVQNLLLIKKSDKGFSFDQVFSDNSYMNLINVQNQIGILKSFSLNRKVATNLNLAVSWYSGNTFYDREVYGNLPYHVIVDENTNNPKGVPLHLKILNGTSYKIFVDEETVINGMPVNIKFEQEGRFGEVFSNLFFRFIIEKTGYNLDGNFYFVFNNLDRITLNYISKLDISQSEKNGELVHISLTGPTPAKEVDYINELANVFIQFGLSEKNQASENTVRFIDSQLSTLADTLKVSGRTFTDFRSRKQIVDISQEAGLIVQEMVKLESEQSKARMQVEYYESLQKYLGDAKQMKQMVAPSVVGITDVSLNNLILKLSELYNKREVLSYSVQSKNPTLILLGKEIDLTLQTIRENLDNLLDNGKLELRNLDKRIAQVNGQLSQYPETEQELINIKRQFELSNELYTFLLQRRAEAAIITASNVPDAQIVDTASISTAVRTGPKTLMNLLLFFLAALMIPVSVIFLGDYFNNTIQTREEVEKLTQLPIVGTIPHSEYKIGLPVGEHPNAGITESFRGLRTNLQFLLSGEGKKVIAVHSLFPGEGKSFITSNLGVITALNNKKVLVIGADLRKSVIHKVFGCENKAGLSTYLIQQDTYEEIIINTGYKNLDLIPAGPVPPNPAELIGNKLFKSLIEKAVKEYDYIIIDNAPASIVTDGTIVSRLADTNLFVLRQKFSNKKQVELINQFVTQGIVEKIALILNDVKSQGYYGSKYYSYKYGYYNYGYGYYNDKPVKGVRHKIKKWFRKKSNKKTISIES